MAAPIGPLIPAILGWYVTGDLGPYTCYTNHNGKIVFFDRAPPLSPPRAAQIEQRNTWRLTAITWQGLTQDQRQAWTTAARRANLCMTGYGLFVWWRSHPGDETIRTIERQTQIQLAP